MVMIRGVWGEVIDTSNSESDAVRLIRHMVLGRATTHTIAAELGVSRATVCRYMKRYGIKYDKRPVYKQPNRDKSRRD